MNLPSPCCSSRLLGSFTAKSGMIPDIALGDEQIDEAVIVHVLELRVPGRAGPQIVAHVRAVRGDALGPGHVGVDGFGAVPSVGTLPSVCSLLSAIEVRKYSG